MSRLHENNNVVNGSVDSRDGFKMRYGMWERYICIDYRNDFIVLIFASNTKK